MHTPFTCFPNITQIITGQLLIYPKKTDGLIAGIDEAGRGCLAGPVVAAAVILPPNRTIDGLNDSKKITESKRYLLRTIIEQVAVCYGIGIVAAPTIDKINILQATYAAMHAAINRLTQTPDLLLIDGNRYKPVHVIPYQTIVKGDSKYAAIAAASILAKTYRDDIMNQASTTLPQYLWHSNKGYPTQEHKQAILEKGQTPMHRISFTIKSARVKPNG